MDNEYILEVKKITKQFPGTVALNQIDFNLQRGEVHAIVGENGAGKSTLMKILSGAYTKTSGEILFRGEVVDIRNVQDSQALGISMIYQELENIPKLTVAENIYLGRLPRGHVPGFVNFNELYDIAGAVFKDFKININPKAKLSSLSTAQQQFIEIIKAVTIANAQIIIMDEPTSSLTKEETDKLFSIIETLKVKDISIIYISHRLDEIVGVADRVSVFRDGKNRGTLSKEEFDKDRIITLMLGHSITTTVKEVVERREVVFEVKNLIIKNRIHNFNMKLYSGEILGIAGLMGSGKDELVKSLFGLWPAESKEIFFKGTRIFIRHPIDAIKLGIVYLPEERKLQSLFLELSVRYNISPLWLFNVYGKFVIGSREESELARIYIDKLSIKTPSIEEDIVGLSGGNQQKTIFSRLLTITPKLMILNDPTRGVDVGSKEEIYKIIRELASQGTSILLLSSEIPELNYLANRVIVLSKGEMRGEFVDDDVTTKNILVCATGA
jgi:ABC-type sugar transport system ATPase subunit